jgi:endopeptidase Clp ATP-binding regulatory subunit ClpX
MTTNSEKIPSPKELEKEIGEFLAKKFGGDVKIVSPSNLPKALAVEDGADGSARKKQKINFDLKPEELVDHLDQYIVRQDTAKAILATKICTHFNRIKYAQSMPDAGEEMVGRIKNNVLMIGPTGVGKTYMIRLIAQKLGVPFVKGDATKFSETGYVGGDVEDLVRDLVREADGDISLAENGIIYIDEIDKIAASQNFVGADVSRTGVQRALLKPMEETEVEMKAPHDPISMMQEIERFRRTGQREQRTVSTRNILFIMSGAFGDLAEIIEKRLTHQPIGFGAQIRGEQEMSQILGKVRSEDLTRFGFEAEFIGRLPVVSVFETLSESDLLEILKNPNNPVILGKKLDFAAYGIRIKFAQSVLKRLAAEAHAERTGARGLVSAVERALLIFEKGLPSTPIRMFPVTDKVLDAPEAALREMIEAETEADIEADYQRLFHEEKAAIKAHVTRRKQKLSIKYGITLTPPHIDAVADYYCRHITNVETVVRKVKQFSDEIKKMELYFFQNHDINIVLEEDAVHYFIQQYMDEVTDFEEIYRRFCADFEYGLKLVRERIGRNRFFITREALEDPETYIGNLLQDTETLSMKPPKV